MPSPPDPDPSHQSAPVGEADLSLTPFWDAGDPQRQGLLRSGWARIIFDLHEQLRAIDPQYEVLSVGSRFGVLYVEARVPGQAEVAGNGTRAGGAAAPEGKTTPELVKRALSAASERSRRTCRSCGAPGVVALHPEHREIVIACDSCARKQGAVICDPDF